MNSIFLRRSIRSFSDKEVECSKLENILRAGMQAPSAWNFQPWEFLIVENQKTKDDILKVSPYANAIGKAPMSIIVMCNLEKLKKDDQWWVQDLSAATENMLLQIVEEGLGGVWLGIYPDKDRVNFLKEYFNLPENIVPFSIISMGYSQDENKFVDRFDNEKIYFEKYNK